MTEISTIEIIEIWPSHISHVIGAMIKPIMMIAIPIMMVALMFIVMVAIPKRELKMLKMFSSHIWFEPIEYILAIVVDHIHSSVICVSGHVSSIIELIIPFLAFFLSFFPKFLTLLTAEL